MPQTAETSKRLASSANLRRSSPRDEKTWAKQWRAGNVRHGSRHGLKWFRQTDASVRNGKMLGEMLSIGRSESADSATLRDKMFEDAPRHGMDVAQINDGLRQFHRRGRRRKEVPTVHHAPPHVIAHGRCFHHSFPDQVLCIMNHGNQYLVRLRLGQVTGLCEDDRSNKPSRRLRLRCQRRRNLVGPEDRAAIDDVTLRQRFVGNESVVDHCTLPSRSGRGSGSRCSPSLHSES